MKKLIKFGMITLLSFFVYPSFGQFDCNKILKPELIYQNSNYYSKVMVSKKIAEGIESKTEDDQKFGGSAIVEGLPVGGDYSRFQKNEWSKNFNQSYDSLNIASYSSQYFYMGFKESQINTWFDCIKLKSDFAFEYKVIQLLDNLYQMKILYINNICSNISVRLSIKSNKNLEVELDSVIKPGDYKFNINRININKEASLILRAQIGEKNMDYDLHLTPIVPIPSIPENKIKLKFRCLSTFRNGYVYRDTTEYFELPKELNSTKDYVEFTGNYGGPMGFIIKVKDDGSYCGYIYTKNGNSLGTFRKEGLSLTNREVFKMEIDRIMIK